MRICDRHDTEIPLIWTLAFNGAEYWCPYCGANYGMLGAGVEADDTDELTTRLKSYEAISEDYLRAIATENCNKVKHGNEWISPENLPQEIKDKNAKAIEDWAYELRL